MFIFLPNWEVWLVLLTAHAGNFSPFSTWWPTHSCLYAAPHHLSHLDAPHPYIRVFMHRWLSNPNHAIFSQRRNFQFVLFFLVTVLFPSLFHPLIGRGLFHAKKPFNLSVHWCIGAFHQFFFKTSLWEILNKGGTTAQGMMGVKRLDWMKILERCLAMGVEMFI